MPEKCRNIRQDPPFLYCWTHPRQGSCTRGPSVKGKGTSLETERLQSFAETTVSGVSGETRKAQVRRGFWGAGVGRKRHRAAQPDVVISSSCGHIEELCMVSPELLQKSLEAAVGRSPVKPPAHSARNLRFRVHGSREPSNRLVTKSPSAYPYAPPNCIDPSRCPEKRYGTCSGLQGGGRQGNAGDLRKSQPVPVGTPAKAGVQEVLKDLVSGFRRNDGYSIRLNGIRLKSPALGRQGYPLAQPAWQSLLENVRKRPHLRTLCDIIVCGLWEAECRTRLLGPSFADGPYRVDGYRCKPLVWTYGKTQERIRKRQNHWADLPTVAPSHRIVSPSRTKWLVKDLRRRIVAQR